MLEQIPSPDPGPVVPFTLKHKSFLSSNFKKHYEETGGAQFQDQLMSAVRTIILAYCKELKVDELVGIRLFERLQNQAFESKDGLKELLGNVAYAAQR